jgi:regulator of protease activity HflC (stomatin/prohibitin superfamily)
VAPFCDSVRRSNSPTVDLREQVLPFDPQAVITADNVGIQIANVIYYQIVDAKTQRTRL